LTEIEVCIVALSKAWHDVFDDAQVFVKLHHIEFHVWVFVTLNQMYGRLSEEGFEASHPVINDVQSMLSGIAGTQQKMECFNKRMNMKTDKSVQDVVHDVKAKSSGKSHGGARTYNMNPRPSDDLQFTGCSSIISCVNGYLQLSSGSVIPEHWKEVYLLCALNKVPSEWHRVFNSDNDLTDERKKEAEYA